MVSDEVSICDRIAVVPFDSTRFASRCKTLRWLSVYPALGQRAAWIPFGPRFLRTRMVTAYLAHPSNRFAWRVT